MGRGKRLTQQAKISATILVLSAGGALGQTLDSTISASIGLTSSVSANTNKFLAAASPGTTFDVSERLSFSLITQNSISLFEVFGSASLDFDDIGSGISADLSPPTVTLHYARDTGNSDLDASVDFLSDTVVSSFDLDPTMAVFIIVDTGTLTSTGADLALNTGVNAPLGFSFTTSYNDRDYKGTTDPALFDSTTTSFGAKANLRISPSTQGTLSASITDYESSAVAPGLSSSQTTAYNLSVSHDLANALTISGNVGFRERDKTIAAGASTTTSGFFAGVDVVRDLPDGNVFGGVKVDASDDSTSAALTFGRTMDLPDGSLTASLEINNTDGSGVQFLGKAAYRKDMPAGSVTVNLNQSLTTDTLDQDIKVSNLGIDYNRALTGTADLNLALNLSRSEDSGAGAAATLNRATASATFSKELTPDWAMQLGYSHRLSSGSAVATANSDSIFLTLTRDILFGF